MGAKKHKFIGLLAFGSLIFVFLFTSCRDDEPIPDVSNVGIDFQLFRFDSVYYNTDSVDIPQLYDLLKSEHHDFFKGFMRVMVSPTVRVEDTIDFLQAMQHHGMVRLFDTTEKIIGDFTQERKDFAQALKFSAYYFPDKKIPRLYTFISEFGRPAFITADDEGRDVLASGLDLFLGKEFPGYDPMIFPQYIRRSMTPKHLVSKTMEAYTNDLAGEVPGEQFLDYIITNGKSLFLLDHFMPTTPDSILLEYTAAQMKWTEENEFQMWSHFVHESLLYSTKMRDFRKLINPSPNATGMPPEAPGRTGNYMGWQIIKAYMKRYPKTTFQELMDIKDSKKILKMSKYKPKAR